MSFRKNDAQQITFSDSLFDLTEREKKALDKSWAKVFADEVFPAIDEERFRVLYSEGFQTQHAGKRHHRRAGSKRAFRIVRRRYGRDPDVRSPFSIRPSYHQL